MKRKPRLVIDTNVVVSGLFWGGKPGLLLTLASEGEIRPYISNALLAELRATLARPKLARVLEASGRPLEEIIHDYRRLCTLARPAPLPRPVSRDPDDDHVIACALAARANFLVSGDDDLLALGAVGSVAIRSVAAMMTELS